MVEVLPRYAVILQVLVIDLLTARLRQALVFLILDFVVQLLDTGGREHTLVVQGEDTWSLHLAINCTISHDLLHHFLLRGVTVALADKVGALDFGVGLALLVVGASVAFRLSDVWSAILRHEVAVLGEEPVEEWPSAITSLIHVVARHEVLCRQLWHFFAVFDFQSVFGDLGERDSVAGTAMTLVSVLVHEVIATDISPVEVVRQLAVWNGISIRVVFLELLRFLNSRLEIGTLSELDGAGGLVVGLSEDQWLIAVSAVVVVRFLVFAHVSLPSQVHLVDGLDQQISLISRHVLNVRVVPRVRLSPTEEDILLIWWRALAAGCRRCRSIGLLRVQLVLD